MLTVDQKLKCKEITTKALNRLEVLVDHEPFTSEIVYVSTVNELVSIVERLNSLN